MNPVTADALWRKRKWNYHYRTCARASRVCSQLKDRKGRRQQAHLVRLGREADPLRYVGFQCECQLSSSWPAASRASLNGNMAINLTNGKLMNLDLLMSWRSVGNFRRQRFGPPKNFTDLFQLIRKLST